MLMPQPVVIQWRTRATAQACQLNRNSAARAPPWRNPNARLLVQFTFCGSALLRRLVLTRASRLSHFYGYGQSFIELCRRRVELDQFQTGLNLDLLTVQIGKCALQILLCLS